jgi:hypothetical protein
MLALPAGASEEEIMFTLAECNNDVNETTSRLIDSKNRTFSCTANALCSVLCMKDC